MITVEPNLTGPGVSFDPAPKVRDPYDIKTWGPECGRGIDFGVSGKSNHVSGGRKHRGTVSDVSVKSDNPRGSRYGG